MKTGISSLGCPEWSLEKIAETVARLSFDGVELRGVRGEHVHTGLSRDERSGVARIFRQQGVKIFSITAYTKFDSLEQEEFTKTESELISYVHLAKDLGASYVRTFIGGLPKGIESGTHDERVAASLVNIARAVEGTGISILVETHDRISSVAAALRIVNLAAHPQVGILWDIAHSLRAGDSLVENASLLGGKLGYVHLKDELPSADNQEHPVLPGQGIIPIKDILAALETVSFNGYLCLEWERKWHPELEPLDAAMVAYKKWLHLE